MLVKDCAHRSLNFVQQDCISSFRILLPLENEQRWGHDTSTIFIYAMRRSQDSAGCWYWLYSELPARKLAKSLRPPAVANKVLRASYLDWAVTQLECHCDR